MSHQAANTVVVKIVTEVPHPFSLAFRLHHFYVSAGLRLADRERATPLEKTKEEKKSAVRNKRVSH
jgi:hypothetical protein